MTILRGKRAVLYLRVSSARQETANQRPEVEQLAAARELTIVHVYEEVESAAKRRPEFEAMLASAHRGEFDTLVLWSLDRFGRSMVGNIQDVLALDGCGVQVLSVKESWLDMKGPVRGLLVGIFSWVAEQERARLIERTHAGLERARRAGKQLGRPRRFLDQERVQELFAAGFSVRAIASELDVGAGTVFRALKAVPKTDPDPPPGDG